MKLKKYIALALAGAMSLSLSLLAGCQNNTPTGGSSGTPADQSQPQTGAQVPEGALVLKEQGMFSAGGTVLTSDGTFDVSNCENSNAVLMMIDPWAGIHPLLKVLPMDWDCKMSFGLLHSPKPSPAIRRLLDAFRTVYL